MMENELKPCPFCGGHADIIYRVDIGFQYRPDVVIGCASPQCGVMPKTSELPHGQAIAAWNARAVPSPEFTTSNPFNDIYHEAVNLMCFTHPDHADDARKCFDILVANWNALRMSLFTEDSND